MPQYSLLKASKGLVDIASYAHKQKLWGEPRSSNPAVFARSKYSKEDKRAKRTARGMSFPEETNLRQQCYATVLFGFVCVNK